MSGERSLKSLNMKWLVLLAVADVLAVLVYAAPKSLGGFPLTQGGVAQILTTTVMPIVVLLLVNVVPSDVKAMLVFWRPRGVLPGSEGFTRHGPSDPRVDMTALKKNVGELPTDPPEQNAKWYKLFKMVQNEPTVAEAHKLFLIYRDMAAFSLPLILIVPLLLSFVSMSRAAPWLAAALFSLQYLLTALSARWAGIRLVSNVLAVHSTNGKA